MTVVTGGGDLATASVAAAHDTVLVLDFGSQYSQLIARRVREAKVYCELLPGTVSADEVRRLDDELPDPTHEDADRERHDGRVDTADQGEHADDHPEVHDGRAERGREEPPVGIEGAHHEGGQPDQQLRRVGRRRHGQPLGRQGARPVAELVQRGRRTGQEAGVVGAAQGPVVQLQRYLGYVVQFPLSTPIPVRAGEAIGLTVPIPVTTTRVRPFLPASRTRLGLIEFMASPPPPESYRRAGFRPRRV